MENLKIRVNTDQESKEAQELFFELGGDFYFGGKLYCNTHLELVTINKDGLMANIELDGFDYTEITLPQLKDMVVLKRNDQKDATHIDDYNDKWLVNSLGSFNWCDENWIDKTIDVLGYALKPIEKEMKEYLTKMQDGSYKLIATKMSDDDIGVPEGAEALVYFCGESKSYFYKSGDFIFDGCWRDVKRGWKFKDVINGVAGELLWQRETLNDKVASAEVARQEEKTALDELMELRYSDEEIKNRSAWDKQVGGLHYKDFAIQPMHFALANQLDYAQSNVIKYVTRHAQKNGKQDLLKAIHNIELMIEYYYPE